MKCGNKLCKYNDDYYRDNCRNTEHAELARQCMKNNFNHYEPADLPEAEASAERISSVVRLLPCPFCGSVECCVNNHGNKYFVVCNCGTQTDNYDTVDKAIIFWNTRQ